MLPRADIFRAEEEFVSDRQASSVSEQWTFATSNDSEYDGMER